MSNMRSSTLFACGLAAVIALLLASVPVSAAPQSVDLAAGQSYEASFILQEMSMVSFKVDVTSGPSVRVMILDQENHQRFLANRSYETRWSSTVDHIEATVVEGSGTYYFVLVNENNESVTATYEYSVAPGMFAGLGALVLLAVIGAVAAVVIMIVVLYLLLIRTKGPPSPMAPAQGRFCSGCGRPLPPEASYCPGCGKRV